MHLPIAMSSDRRQTLGELGETLACDELRRRGYAILERRYRTRYGEIDIVARHGDVLVFVEVKARAGDAFGTGAEAVTAYKQRRVARMAEVAQMPTTVHISGGFGFVYMLHFASCTPRIGPWQEYKSGVAKYGGWFTPPLAIRDGAITVPTGPGVGIAEPAEVLKGAKLVM